MNAEEHRESGWDLERFLKLRARVEARVRQRAPFHMVEELADRAIVRAFLVSIRRGDIRSLDALALRLADTTCADWHRRQNRRGQALHLADSISEEDISEYGPAVAQRLRKELGALLPRLRPLLVGQEEELVEHLVEGVSSARALAKRMSLSRRRLSDLIAGVACKILRILAEKPGH